MKEDEKIFVTGHVTAEEGKNSKLIAEQIQRFEDMPKVFWVKYKDRAEYEEKQQAVLDVLALSDGKDNVRIYLEAEQMVKNLPASRNVLADESLIGKINEILGEGRAKITW